MSLTCSKDGGCFWRRLMDGRVHFGIAYGAAGVAFYLLHLYGVTGETKYLRTAKRALRFELAHALEQFGGLGWLRWEGDTLLVPYWMYGSAGLVAVLSRFYRQLGDEEDLQAARRAADGAFARFSLQTDQFAGLSGLGEAMLDMYLVTGDKRFLAQASDIADSLLRFRIERPEGIAFPGRLLLRVSNDFGTGGAGVGLFLERLSKPGPRLLHDLEATCAREASFERVAIGEFY